MPGKILIADDEPAFRRLAASWLAADGHDVVTAADGAAAKDTFAAGGIDLVLLDLVMPPARTPEDGLALLPDFAGRPVVVLTGHADHRLALAAVADGAWDFLAKPVDPDMLRFVVARALAKARLEREVEALRARVGEDQDGLLGVSPAMDRLRDLVRRIGPTDLAVLILGPSGSGKERVAEALHRASRRRARAFLVVHCGAIPAELLESELFGHLKGSFTGADSDRPGLLAAADGGTLFLDEIGEMPMAMQVKLLRFLQDGRYLPVGAREARAADVRLISATHRDLEAMVADGSFREDLFYRIRGLTLRTPALAERPDDIPVLAQAALPRGVPGLAPAALAWLAGQRWRGNVRELQAVVRAAAAVAPDGRVTPAHLSFAQTGDPRHLADPTAEAPAPAGGSLPDQVAALERRLIGEALAAAGHNHSEVARRLGISRVGLLKKLDRLGLRRDRGVPATPPPPGRAVPGA